MKKKSTKKHIPLNLKISYSETNDLDNLKDNLDFKKIVYNETANVLLYLSENKRSKIDLFNLMVDDKGLVVSIEKKDYKTILDSTIQFYGEQEDYDKCIELTKLKDKL